MCDKPKNTDGNFRGIRHGFHGTPLYKKWKSMRARVATHPLYIEKNIKCCKDWDSFLNFKEWAESSGFSEDLSLDRVDTLGDYEPSNCRWTNATVQAENQWLRKDNSTGYKGVSLDKRNMTYKVQIQINKVKVFIGRFKTDIEAALAFDSYVDKIGSNHRKNFV